MSIIGRKIKLQKVVEYGRNREEYRNDRQIDKCKQGEEKTESKKLNPSLSKQSPEVLVRNNNKEKSFHCFLSVQNFLLRQQTNLLNIFDRKKKKKERERNFISCPKMTTIFLQDSYFHLNKNSSRSSIDVMV